MSIKSFIKAYSPELVLSFLRAVNRRIMPHIISARVLKYLPYYQDELSREILSDQLRYLKTHDKNIFLDRAEKIGMKFSGYPYFDYEEYSGLVLLYDNQGCDFRYMQRVLNLDEWANKYRLMTLKDFLNGAEVSSSELVSFVLTPDNREKFKKVAKERKVQICDGLFSDGLVCINREDLQYFDVFSPVDDEVVIDAGAFDGATAIRFLEWGKGKVKKVYSFEFDIENAAKCEENLKPYADKITLVKKGTWDKDEVIHASSAGGAGSSISVAGDTEAYLTSIDSVVKNERVTFIKMDVEGAELKSLMGARNTIIKNHPRLAICVYHKPSDLYEIPGYILSLVPEYKFHLRHYCSREWETILYASCE